MEYSEKIKYYSELLCAAYTIIFVVCAVHYLDLSPPENVFAKCDIIHEARSGKERCGYFDEEVSPLEY